MKLSAPKPLASKLSVSAKPLQKQRSNYLVSPTTGEKGRVLEPLNNKPEYHRKTAMTNKYLTKIAETFRDENMPTVNSVLLPGMAAGTLGGSYGFGREAAKIVDEAGGVEAFQKAPTEGALGRVLRKGGLGLAVGTGLGVGATALNNYRKIHNYENDLVSRGLPQGTAREVARNSPIGMVSPTLGLGLAGAGIGAVKGYHPGAAGAVGAATGLGLSYLANRVRENRRNKAISGG